MQIDTSSKLYVDSSFTLCGEPALNTSSSGPLLSRIPTHSDEQGSDHTGHAHAPFTRLGIVSDAPESRDNAFISDEDILNSASAPEHDNAFPSEQKSRQRAFSGGLSSSPAQAFLSMFSPPSASSLAAREETVVAGYTLVQTIGRGGFSTVKKGVSSKGDLVAIKRVKKVDLERQEDPDECRRQLENEIDIWRTLKHEHILPLFDVERTLDADYFITLYCPAGSLFDILKRDGHPALPQDDAGMMFRQVVRGLRYLHNTARIVHGDIKLENVLVDEAGMCRISDFGLARRISDPSLPQSETDCPCLHDQAVDHAIDRLRRFTTISHASSRHAQHGRLQRSTRHRNSTPLGSGHDTPRSMPHPQFPPGSLPYASPELLAPPPPQCPLHPRLPPANPAQDMWALGVLLYALLTGHLPFNDSFEPRLQMKILHGAYDPPPGIGHGAESVLRGCLEHNVPDRWTVDMVDDVAWGVGWGEAGNASAGSPSRAVAKTSR
ncbi:hypothetical protein ACEPAF_9381 [Sanghuangporus sanghuang]